MMNLPMDVFLIVLLSLILISAAINDLRFQKIPNLITYPSMAVAIGYYGVVYGMDGLLFSAGGLMVGIGVFIIPYSMGIMGAGDAKLMGAAGAILGAKGVLIAMLFTAIVGGVYALVLLLIHRQYGIRFIRRLLTTLKTFVLTRQFIPIPETQKEAAPKLCYGVAIALGTLIHVSLELSGHSWLS
jgi:prepilin peptidase CpaA